jgi:hypothetical protein
VNFNGDVEDSGEDHVLGDGLDEKVTKELLFSK